LDRYADFIQSEFLAGLHKGAEYSVEAVGENLLSRLRNGSYRRLVFTGMGCSAIVSDVIRGYLQAVGSDLDVYVVNDYDFSGQLPRGVLEDERTLIVVSSYSGHSQEPLLATRRLLPMKDRTLLLTSGGTLAKLGREEGISILYWRLSRPDREYPLFHVTQYFAILLDFLAAVGLVDRQATNALRSLPDELSGDFRRVAHLAPPIAADSVGANLLLLASPRWYDALLKICKMHLNEIAMVPAGRNYIHEFCHSEVATLSAPDRRHTVIAFVDEADDEYTRGKVANLRSILSTDHPANQGIAVHVVYLDQPGYTRKLFTALNLIQHVTLDLGRVYDTRSRDLISEAAGNRWYHSSTIEADRTVADRGAQLPVAEI